MTRQLQMILTDHRLRRLSRSYYLQPNSSMVTRWVTSIQTSQVAPLLTGHRLLVRVTRIITVFVRWPITNRRLPKFLRIPFEETRDRLIRPFLMMARQPTKYRAS